MQPTMQAPAFLTARQGRGLSVNAAAGISGAMPPRISIAANKFTLIDGAGNQRPHTVTMTNQQGQLQQFLSPYVDVIIVGVNMNVSKMFYDTAFDPDVDAAPVCWSDNGVGPSTGANKPQANTCAICPNNQWGSAVSNMTGKKVKACTDAKKIAVILPGDPIVYQFRIPPATLKALKNHADTIGNYSLQDPSGKTRGADLCDVVTRIEFESQGVLKFTPVGFIDEAIAAHIDAITQDKLDLVMGTADRPISSLPAPQGQPPLQVAHQPAPQMAPTQPQFTPSQQPAPGVQGFVMAPPAQFQGAPPPNGPVQSAQTPKRGRGRPPAATTAPQVQAPQATIVQGPPAMVVMPQPQFAAPQPMQAAPQTQPAASQWTPPAHAAPPGAPATNFGMAQPGTVPVPDEAMQKAVFDAMNFKPQ